MDRSPPGSSIHGVFQARVLEWGAMAFSIGHPYLTQRAHAKVNNCIHAVKSNSQVSVVILDNVSAAWDIDSHFLCLETVSSFNFQDNHYKNNNNDSYKITLFHFEVHLHLLWYIWLSIKVTTDKFSFDMVKAEAAILWPPDAKSQLTGKGPDAGGEWRQEMKEATEEEMAGWHHWLNGHELEQALGDSKGQGSWRAAVHGVPKSQTRLSDWTSTASPPSY